MLHISDSFERPEAGLPHVVIWRPLQVGLTNLTRISEPQPAKTAEVQRSWLRLQRSALQISEPQPSWPATINSPGSASNNDNPSRRRIKC